MRAETQTALLRVLQEREVVRLGENKPRKIDMRVLAATQHDLTRAVEQGRLRSDLLYRIRVGRVRRQRASGLGSPPPKSSMPNQVRSPYSASGTYWITLTVTAHGGATGSLRGFIAASDVSMLPVAKFGTLTANYLTVSVSAQGS